MTRKLMLEDLKRSGITEQQAKSLGYKVLTPTQTATLTGQTRAAVPSYLIPYFDIRGKSTDYWRIRYLEAPSGSFGAKLTDRRYTQPPNSPPHLYFPRTLKWRNPIARDPKQFVLITEGEKKAAAGCLVGIPTIGLGGVWSWSSKKQMLPEFDEFEWQDRDVYLVFDSDLNEKPQVAGALYALADALFQRGAKVKQCFLKGSKTNKVGLDDFLVKHKSALAKEKALAKLLGGSEEFVKGKALRFLNTEIALIDHSKLYHLPSAALFTSKTPLRDITYAGLEITITTPAGKEVQKHAIDEWLKWSQRREHAQLTYAPDQPTVLPNNEYNIWPGWGVEPQVGNVKPFLKLIDYLCEDDQAFKHWFLQWLAYPLQYPGVKMNSSVVLWSPAQGVGKTFVGMIMGDIYGDNFLNLTEETLHGPFNGWAARRQFILGDEITGSDRRRDADKLKGIITQESIYVNAKYQAEYRLPDRINYLFTTNHPSAFFLEDTDRRFAVHRINSDAQPRSFYTEVDKWRFSGGPSHLFDWLLQYDVSGFYPRAPALRTASKEEMIDLGRTELEDWLAGLLASPTEVLQMQGVASKKELWTSSELASLFDSENRLGSGRNVTIGRALTKRRLKCRTIKTASGAKKLWAIVNRESWEKKEPIAWGAHVNKFVMDKGKFK